MDASRRIGSHQSARRGETVSVNCCGSNPGQPQYLGMCKNCYESGSEPHSHQTEPRPLAKLSARSYNDVPAQCDFVDPIPEALVCPVCLLPFRDPHLLDCCGAKYCAECIRRVKESGQPCPICREHQFNTMLDKNDQRKVLGLRVRCSKTNEGCEWMGELRHLNDHEKDECEWALVKCRHECGQLVFLCRLTEHEEDECPQRPMDVKMKSLMRKMEDRHKLEIAAVREEFRRAIETKNEEIKQLQQSLDKVIMSLSVQEEMPTTKRNAVRGADCGEHDTVSDFKRSDAGARYDDSYLATTAVRGVRRSHKKVLPKSLARGVGTCDEKVLPKNLCRTTGCSFYAVPEYNYCWKH